MSVDVFYLGDTSLDTAAAYLAGIMQHANISFRYVASDQVVNEADFETTPKAVILSDFPAANLALEAQTALARSVQNGTGLLMCGGWESYQGCDGHWKDTPIGELLPVDISSDDDRINCDQPLFVRQSADHPIIDGLPWSTRAPLIGGFNKFQAKSYSNVLLESHRYQALVNDDQVQLTLQESNPLLVVDQTDSRRIAALATDVAPHWVGPLVDWGESRVSAQATGGEAVEVGNLYAKFLTQLVTWVIGES